MPVVRTDDAARRLRFIFLGPGTWEWPPAPIGAYVFGIPTAIAGSLTATVALTDHPVLLLLCVVGWPILVAVAVLSFFRKTSADATPLHHIGVLEAEVTGNRPEPDKADTRTIALSPDLLPPRMED